MNTPPKRTPSGRDGTTDSLYRSYRSQRLELFHQGTQERPMANRTTVQIGVIADDQEHIVSLPNTLYDSSLTHSLMPKSKAFATAGRIKTTSPITLTDSHGHAFASSTTITLRWRYDTGLQSFQETFYVVDGCAGYDAMLRQNIETKPEDAHPLQAHPLKYQGHYKSHEMRDKEARDREKQEKFEREIQDDRERAKRNIDALKKAARKP